LFNNHEVNQKEMQNLKTICLICLKFYVLKMSDIYPSEKCIICENYGAIPR